ncbi:Hsp20/alpha crystallin family protein [Clostridium sp.]|uniref:Hsp20/alpha crystallin family protein n=1 Tax=Clostridium sp. TaxID=1506 RepID=UPI001DAD591D|nr:Hsp20/alpha crystallin family protein [Clostridium sp.]MBS5939928.1 Hsp20/alpha crystallin family protein [Clostridium sp.]
MKENLLDLNKLNKNKNPIINIVDKDNFYDIYIFLQDLTKEEILIKYVNNFLVLNLSLKSKENLLYKFKRIFYLKNVDIDRVQNSVHANLVYIKIPKGS